MDFYANHTLQHEEEEEWEEELFMDGVQLLLFVVAGAEEARLLRNERRRKTRLYLRRPELLPNPQEGTPWQVLFRSRSDRAFITTMGFNTQVFDEILASGFRQKWYEWPIPCHDTNPTGNTCPGARSLDAEGALGLVLHYLSSTMHKVSLQQIFAIIPSTTSRYIAFALDILRYTLRDMEASDIRWPRRIQDFTNNSHLIQERHPRLKGAFASIDGLSDHEIENATYNGWLSEHFISSVLVFDPQGECIGLY